MNCENQKNIRKYTSLLPKIDPPMLTKMDPPLVWTDDKMELLIDTLLKGDSFGGVMVIEEDRERVNLFLITDLLQGTEN